MSKPAETTSPPVRFTISVPEQVLADLRQRLLSTRWPDVPGESDWGEGVPVPDLQRLARYWAVDFDWRAREQELNEVPHFRVTIDGVDLHYLHIRGRGPRPLPLVLTHGWPSSFFEFWKLIPLLVDPGARGGDPSDAFDIVVPAYPGFPCSPAPRLADVSGRVPGIWRRLMTDVLGYEKFGAFGGDIGAPVTAALGRDHAEAVVGIVVLAVLADVQLGDPSLSAAEREFLEARREWARTEGGYMHMQQTRPRTLAYGLSDSPAGLLAWIVEKFRAWSDCGGDLGACFTDDELLVTPTLYWFANSIGPSFRPYVEAGDILSPQGFGTIDVPVGVAAFPADLPVPPREYAERHYNVQRWTVLPRGGHFGAFEEPDLLARELREFFAPLRN